MSAASNLSPLSHSLPQTQHAHSLERLLEQRGHIGHQLFLSVATTGTQVALQGLKDEPFEAAVLRAAKWIHGLLCHCSGGLVCRMVERSTLAVVGRQMTRGDLSLASARLQPRLQQATHSTGGATYHCSKQTRTSLKDSPIVTQFRPPPALVPKSTFWPEGGYLSERWRAAPLGQTTSHLYTPLHDSTQPSAPHDTQYERAPHTCVRVIRARRVFKQL